MIHDERRVPPTVLVIDDDPGNLEVASEHLRRYAYRVLTARDGATGLRRARLASPDLILLDIQMPGVDGFEACRRLKASPETAPIPVLFTTAFTDTDVKLRAFELGGVDYTTKPFEAPVLLARVRAHLTLRAQRRQHDPAGDPAALEVRAVLDLSFAEPEGPRVLVVARADAARQPTCRSGDHRILGHGQVGLHLQQRPTVVAGQLASGPWICWILGQRARDLRGRLQ